MMMMMALLGRNADNARRGALLPLVMFVVTTVLLGSVELTNGHADCGKKGKDMDIFFSLCQQLGTRYKRGLEKFDVPKVDFKKHEDKEAEELALESEESEPRKAPLKRQLPERMASLAAPIISGAVEGAIRSQYPESKRSYLERGREFFESPIRRVLDSSNPTTTPPPPPKSTSWIPSIQIIVPPTNHPQSPSPSSISEEKWDLSSLSVQEMDVLYIDAQESIARAPRAEAETLKTALAGKCCYSFESCLYDPMLISILKKVCV